MTSEDMYRHYLENQMLTTVLKDCDGRAAMAALNALPTLLHWTITDPVISADRDGATLEFHKPGEDTPTLRVRARREGGLTAETEDGKTARAEDVYSFLAQADIMRAATDLAQAAAEATPPGMGLVEVKTMGRYTEPIMEITSRRADVVLKRTQDDAYGLQVENQGFIFRLETDGMNGAKLIMRGEGQEWEPLQQVRSEHRNGGSRKRRLLLPDGPTGGTQGNPGRRADLLRRHRREPIRDRTSTREPGKNQPQADDGTRKDTRVPRESQGAGSGPGRRLKHDHPKIPGQRGRGNRKARLGLNVSQPQGAGKGSRRVTGTGQPRNIPNKHGNHHAR